MVFKVKKITDTSLSFSSRLLSQMLLIGGIITSQVFLTPLAVQATDSTTNYPGSYDRLLSNCGFNRPFIKAYLGWSGKSSVSSGSTGAQLKQYNVFTGRYENLVYVPAPGQSTNKVGAANTSTADAGRLGIGGWFTGYTLHSASFYTTVHSKESAEFFCQSP